MLAHQGGWDEVLLIIVPMLVVVGLLRLAKHRVERTQLHPDEAAPPDERPTDER